MASDEGVIKFAMEHEQGSALPATELAEVNAWRRILFQLALIGQDPARYGGYGFGNISCRIPPFNGGPNQRTFVISGTQTGGIPNLEPAHYTLVTGYYPMRNLLVSKGPIRPSSESLTHGMVYDLAEDAHWVLHAHSPHIWLQAAALELPMTAADVAYGTPEMAAEVERLFAESDVRARGIFGMGGHEDGIVTFGPTAEAAGSVLINYLAAAYAR
jgi:ribulose-5-phosphate 4-epimerase/fuculose-1-phosphate aldolase